MRKTNKSLSAILAGSALLLTAGIASAQSTVNLTALRQTIVTPDGNIIPMWGWLCGTGTAPTVGGTGTGVPTTTTIGGIAPTCTQTNGVAQSVGTTAPSAVWQPPLITVPYTSNAGASTTGLQIILANTLPVPTSLTIVGQLPNATPDPNGPGNPTRELGRPQHATQTETTWTNLTTAGAAFTPPTQGARAQSFVKEAGATSGTITYTWTALTPGTYLIESGSYPSIQAPMGLYGVLVVTAAPGTSTTGTFAPGIAYPSPVGAVTTTGVPYDADGVLLLSEIDAVQNAAADTAVLTPGFSPFRTWSPACSPTGPATGPVTANTCYPPAVDFTPTYYLIDGHSFDRSNPVASALSIGSTDSTGTVLLRFVNAGLRMHMPSVIGLQMALVAEDGHLQPDVALALNKATALPICPSGNAPIVFSSTAGACPKVQNDWFMPAGKVLDIAVQPAASITTTGSYASAYYPTFDRQLSLSTNNQRDGGMQAYVLINGGTPTVTNGVVTGYSAPPAGFGNLAVTAQANPDSFIIPPQATTFTGNVLANDVGITNAVPSGFAACTAPGVTPAVTTNCLFPNGMFTLTGATAGAAITPPALFTYCGNGAAATTPGLCTTVAFTAAPLGGAPTANAATFTSQVNTLLNVSAPGVLAFDSDPTGYRLYASTAVPVAGTTAPTEGAPPAVTGSCTITLQASGAFTAQSPSTTYPAGNTCTFQYYAVNSQGTASATAATVTLNFPPPSGLTVKVMDGTPGSSSQITDYKWVIEQDLTFKIDPACQTNAGATPTAPLIGSNGKPCPTVATGVPPTLGTNFHTSYMPLIASGCTGAQSCERGQSVYNPSTGLHVPATCNHGVCLPAPAGSYLPVSLPSDVQLNKFEPDGVTPARYYISILPGDAANPANVGNGQPCATPSTATEATGQQVTTCGHTMAGAPIAPPTCTGTGATAVCNYPMSTNPLTATVGQSNYPLVIAAQPNPLLTATLAIFVFEDDAPLNGEHDVGGNNNEPGLGGFQVELWDEMAQAGDFTGQMTYDMFNMPLSNSLNGTIDPLTGLNACPVAATAPDNAGNTNQVASGMIIICPQYESDGVTPSPLAGNALVKNLMPGRFGVVVHPSAAREAAGETWYQTNTLDGTHFLDSFVKVGEPAYFQEYGPGGWHVFMGMANPAVINARKAAFCNGAANGGVALSCNNTITGQVSNLHENRAPDETLFDSGVYGLGDARNYAALAHTTCWASLGDPDGLTFAFTNCDANGNYTFTGIPDGNWALVIGDQWNDLIIDGSSKPVDVCTGATCAHPTPNPYLIDSPTFSWQTHIWNSVFMDLNGNGIQDDPVAEPGLLQVPVRIRMRNGRFNNTGFTDVSGHVNFNETFPLFSWYVIESDNTRFKNTGVHVAYDFGGQIDGLSGTGCLGALSGGSSNQANSASSPCGNGNAAYPGILNSTEPAAVALPSNLLYPGSYYCTTADCVELKGTTGLHAAGRGKAGASGNYSTGRVDPGSVVTEGLQGFLSQTEILEWGKLPYLPGENGGFRGHVVYSSTRPFDDPAILFQNLWEPLVPNVTINLYQENTQPDGSVGLRLVDTTVTSSWDAYAQGFHTVGTTNVPNLNCPGQPTTDPFFNYTLAGTPNYLYPNNPLPNNSQYKCYDGMHNFNQVQPAPYDGLYQFPSAACAVTTATATPTFTVNGQTYTCGTVVNPNAGQPASPAAIFPPGKYVVEVVVPPGYELTKEEDKNILLGDAYVASATISPQFAGLGDIFIVPDQASINQNNINGVYNPAMYSNQTNPSYTGPITGDPNNPPAAYNADGTPIGNNGNPTTTMSRDQFGGFGPGGLITLNSPCVGEVRIVPDFMTISPESGQVAPFAGASRPLCDRKELVLADQMQAQAEFFVWTKTPAATHYTGFILDDFSSEFDQSAPTFGEKFAVPNLPVSIKDFNGVEVSRTYSDQWGLYNGLQFSTWEVNPPNPTGYAPGMYITEMNSAGPIFAPACITAPTATAQGFPLGCVTNQTVPPTITISDPYHNPGYSIFDYENPFMPGDTVYLDTPVVPIMAFAEAYNPPDCAYGDDTPAIKSVTGDTLTLNAASGPLPAGTIAAGPWVSAGGATLTVTAVGDQIVPNYAYSGPSASTSPFNQRTLTRHYGFGQEKGTVMIDSITVPSGSVTWSDMTITFPVPSNLPLCSAGNPAYAVNTINSTARCGELVVMAASGQRSIDSVTVTVGGNAPTYIASEKVNANTFGDTFPNSLQTAIDAAVPGDMIVVGPGTYTEMLLMWKPVRLQGVAAASTIINANTQPAGRLDPWRRELNCLFGLGLNGQEIGAGNVANPAASNVYDPTGIYSCNFGTFSGSALSQAAVDPIELEPVIGWDITGNANLAELLQEPTLMGAYEGAAVTVLAKGLENHEFSSTGTTCSAEGNLGCIVLNSCPVNAATNTSTGAITCTTASTVAGATVAPGDCNPANTKFYTSNFLCNASRVDGLTMTNSSQGGGALFVHGWNHHLEVSNNRMTGNAGTLTGGITLGQPEVPDPTYVTNSAAATATVNAAGAVSSIIFTNRGAGYLTAPTVVFTPAAGVTPTTAAVATATINAAGAVTGVTFTTRGAGYGTTAPAVTFVGTPSTTATPLAIDTFVNMHNNAVTFNSSYGDELNSNTPAAGGGVTVNTGSDNYSFTHNFVCGNLSSGDGGGMTHFGLSFNGNISNNSFLYNQSTNPTLTTNGGGLIVEGNAPDGTLAENSQIDQDAGPSLSDGAGGGLVINANLFQGNTAESGEGGGLRLQSVNGNDILNNPGNSRFWYSVSVTNNVIVNNVAGWEGGGVSIQDAVAVDFRNNTVASNDTTSTAGVLFDTLGAQNAGTPPAGCNPDTGVGCTNPVTTSVPMPAGLVTHAHSLLLSPAFTTPAVACPNAAAAGYTTGTSATNPSSCAKVSLPVIANDVFFNNRPFSLTTAGSPSVVVLRPALSQSATPAFSNGVVTGGTGACPSGANYWDLGVYGDTTISGGNPGGYRLNPTYSVLTGTAGYSSTNRAGPSGGAGLFASMYCNGSRVPPEISPMICKVNTGAPAGTGSETPGCTYPGAVGITTPGGVPDNNPFYANFTLTPAATVDEGNNWINMFYGPLTTINPTIARGGPGYATQLGNYALAGTGSAAYDLVPTSQPHPSTDFFGNPRPEGGGGGGGSFDAGAIEFGSGPVAQIEAFTIIPNSGLRGTAVNVTIDGFNVTAPATVTVSGGGITVSNVAVVGNTSITATFTIAANAALTVRNVTVTSHGTTDTVIGAFTVTAPTTATLTSISPTSGARGQAVGVTLTGTSFASNATVAVSGTGVAVSGVTVLNPTTITATFTIAANAALTARNVTVTNPGAAAASNAVTFTVQGATLTSISPNTGVRGTPANVTLTGTNFPATGARTVNVSGGGVTVSNVTWVSSTTITATFTIANGAGLGAHNVSVTTSIGTTNTVPFTVTGATIAFSAPTPALNGGGTTQKNGTITVSNTATGANAGPFTLTAAPAIATASGTGNGAFSITGGTCASGTVVSSGNPCTIAVQYAGQTNTSTANGRVTLTGTGAATATVTTTFPAN